MEERGLLKSQWNSSEHKRHAKYYELTGKGRKQLVVETGEWESIVRAVTTALRAR
jgi:DNA-binding PadR family transcriptional regulator